MAAAQISITKMDAVRTAIKELGRDASPVSIQEFVKSKFGLDMTTAHVSTYRITIFRKKKCKKAVAGKAESAPAPAPVTTASASTSGPAVSLQDLEAVKELVGRVGEHDLKSLIGILGG